MRYLYFLYLKMRYLRLFGLLGICLAIGLFSASNANAQRVTFGVGIGAPAYYGPAPVCAYGYYDYYPYACAPYGFYGPDWFVGDVFIGAGPWYHGYGRGYYGRGYGYGRGGYRGGYYGRGFDRGYRSGDFHGGNGYRGGYSGGGFRGGNAHSGSGFRGGSNFQGGAGSRGGGNFHGGGGSHGGGGGSHGGGGRH